ncbi:MAG: hypothetical protein U1E29_06540 [Coriobacteriia bacterium]|nr:hypothetical protein [Coriobacteriia bacterium]
MNAMIRIAGALALTLLLAGALVALQCPEALCFDCVADETVGKPGSVVTAPVVPAAVATLITPVACRVADACVLSGVAVPPDVTGLCSRLLI